MMTEYNYFYTCLYHQGGMKSSEYYIDDNIYD